MTDPANLAPNPSPQPPHWMRPKTKKIRLLADPDFDHDPIAQYAIMRWWAEHEFPLLTIYRDDSAPILGRVETLVQGDRIALTSSAWPENYGIDGVIALAVGRGSRELRRRVRWHRRNKTAVVIYRVEQR